MGRSDQVDVTARRVRILVVSALSLALVVAVFVAVSRMREQQRTARVHGIAVLACRQAPAAPDRRPGESREEWMIRLGQSRRIIGQATMLPETRQCVADTERTITEAETHR
jgi:hypothetical protein